MPGRFAILLAVCFAIPTTTLAQPPSLRSGEALPRDLREMYERGLQYLASTQTDRGDWGPGGYDNGPGVTGLALMVFLASGEDPNFGLYSNNVRKAMRAIISQQNASTGYLGSSMYHHGFALLALAEAYGAVDDRNLWPDGNTNQQRSVGAALELGTPLGDHLTEEEYLRRLALLSGCHRRRYLGQRSGACRPARRTQCRH